VGWRSCGGRYGAGGGARRDRTPRSRSPDPRRSPSWSPLTQPRRRPRRRSHVVPWSPDDRTKALVRLGRVRRWGGEERSATGPRIVVSTDGWTMSRRPRCGGGSGAGLPGGSTPAAPAPSCRPTCTPTTSRCSGRRRRSEHNRGTVGRTCPTVEVRGLARMGRPASAAVRRDGGGAPGSRVPRPRGFALVLQAP
jgi:hypothetical protein